MGRLAREVMSFQKRVLRRVAAVRSVLEAAFVRPKVATATLQRRKIIMCHAAIEDRFIRGFECWFCDERICEPSRLLLCERGESTAYQSAFSTAGYSILL